MCLEAWEATVCMLRSCLLASQWETEGGRNRGRKGEREREMKGGGGGLVEYNNQIKTGSGRGERLGE